MRCNLLCATTRQPPVHAIAITGLVLAAAAAIAWPQPVQSQEVPAPADWNYDRLYESGIRASYLMNEATVVGQDEGMTGRVDNLIIGFDGQLLSIIAKVGGGWDIGEEYVNVPWDEVSLEGSELQIPVVEETVSSYPIFPDAAITGRQAGADVTTVGEEVNTVRAFKASELLRDYVRLENHAYFGYVEDLIFDREDGKLLAVIVHPNPRFGADGPLAIPFLGQEDGFDAGADVYDIPYTENEAVLFDQFDLQNLSEAQ